MINILEFNNLELYKNYIYYPIGKETKNRGTAIILASSSFDQSAEMMNDKYVRNKGLYPGYFYENKYNLNIFNKSIRLNITREVSKKFVNMRGDKKNFKFIKKFSYNYEQLAGLNSYIDMSKINEIFFDMANKKDISSFRMVKEYTKIINNINTEIDNATGNAYQNKILLINFDAMGIRIKDHDNFNRNETPNVFAILFYLLKFDFNTFATIPFKILLRSTRYTVLVDPAQCTKDSYKDLVSVLNKMRQAKEIEEAADSEETANRLTKTTDGAKESVTKQEVITDAVSKAVVANILGSDINSTDNGKLKYAFVGDNKSLDNNIEKHVEDAVSELVKENKIKGNEDPKKIDKEVKSVLEKNDDFMTDLELVSANRVSNIMSAGNLARNKELAKKQAQINYKGKTIDAIINESANKILQPKECRAETLNPNISHLKLPNLDKVYNEQVYDRDVIDIINSFKNKSVPVYILNIKKEDSSDDFNKKSTWTVEMESADRVRHKLVFDMPNFVNDSFMYLGGNKKNIYKQMFLLPICKTEPDVVQICTNYNKAFIRRLGDKMAPKSERFRKIIPMFPKIKVVTGDNSKPNMIAVTSLEYDELAKNYTNITVKGFDFVFNLPRCYEIMQENNITIPKSDNIIPIGFDKTGDKIKPIYLDVEKDTIMGTNIPVIDYIVGCISQVIPDIRKEFYSVNVGKKYMYSSVTIMGKHIPLILLLSYVEGLTTILKKGEINHYFTDTRPQLKDDEKNNKDIIQFADGYLVYDKYPYANSLLLNGLSMLPTKNYNYSDLDSKEVYLDIFDDLFSMKKLANALDNFYDLLLDPITLEVLRDLNQPTEFVDVFLYANKLLEDNEYINQIDQHCSRIRSNEIISALLYKTLATAYEGYRITAGNRNPKKMTIPKDQVIKNILMQNTVEDYSTLNPVLEAEKVRAISFKGHSGMNLDRAYTVENRSYDKSMLGILSMSSPPTGSVGVVRQLPLDSNILSTRGYTKVIDSLDELNPSNLFSPAELLVPTCTTKDDAPRIAMTVTQSKHVVPGKKYDKLLVGNGADKVLAEVISDDFAFKAKDDGSVVQLDEANGIVVLKYKNGDYDFIELDAKVSKNGGGGFYISNKLSTNLTMGSKFKKGEVLAANKAYFDTNKDGTATYKAGTLTKVALAQGYYTYEDSSMVSKQLCEDMATEVVMKKDVILGPNSNVDFIVKKGDEIHVGDPLIIFDASYGDEGINKMLASMDDEVSKQISELGKKKLKSKYAGVIEDIKVYYTVELDEMSDSLRKVVKDINAPIEKARKTINKYKDVNSTSVILPPTHKLDTQYGKVKGVTVGDGVYIEFYIKYNDIMKVGDKITFFTALKSVICDVMPEGYESFSEYRPDEKIGAYLAPDSVLKRMVASVLDNMFENKVLIELKRHCKDIYEGKSK